MFSLFSLKEYAHDYLNPLNVLLYQKLGAFITDTSEDAKNLLEVIVQLFTNNTACCKIQHPNKYMAFGPT